MSVFTYIISILTHPLLIVSYGFVLMSALNPFIFGQPDAFSWNPFLAIVLFSTFFIPLLAVVLMKTLGLVKSIELEKKEERIGPIFAAAVLYTAFYFNISRTNDVPPVYLQFLLGVLIGLFLILLVNLFEKLSMHAAGLAGLTVGIAAYYFSGQSGNLVINANSNQYTIHTLVIIISLIILTGLTGSMRISSGAHNNRQVYLGYFVGIIGQVAAIMIYG